LEDEDAESTVDEDSKSAEETSDEAVCRRSLLDKDYAEE
jgi:hypothetical protein